jgi:hypothetical protein
MRETPDIITAVQDWAKAVIPELTVLEDQEDIAGAFPLVAATVSRDQLTKGGGDSTYQQYQQTVIRLWTVRISLYVEADPPLAAEQAVNSLIDQLAADLIAPLPSAPTLGDRVQAASPYYDARYPGEAEHPSGIVARIATFEITVGEGA